MATVKNEESFRQVISLNIFLLKFSGIVALDDRTCLKMVVSYCLTIAAVGILVGLTYGCAYSFVSNAEDMEAAIESLALIFSFCGGLLRFVILYWSRGTVQEILKTVEDLWKILSSQERQYVTSYVNDARNLTYFFMAQCIFVLGLYATAPLLANSADGDLNATRVLPYLFITEVHQSPSYEIMYLLQIFTVLNASLTCVGVEMFGPLVITTVCGHMKVIQKQLRNIDSLGKTNESIFQVGEGDHTEKNGTVRREGETSGQEIRINHYVESLSSELGSCVNYHRAILAICTDIEKLSNFIFLTQLFGSTYILSTVGFKLTGNDPDKYKYAVQIAIGVFQLLICNWPPDALLTESQAVANAAYATSWYNWPSEVKKSIRFVILRAQNPVQLTAGKLFHLSLETFAAMVSTAVSFFMLLQSFK